MLAFSASTKAATVVEFYNGALNNYFITSDANEIAAIDNSSDKRGWIRTGHTFDISGNTPVCRFYGFQSHLFTLDEFVCNYHKQLQQRSRAWRYENIAFSAIPATNGTCPSNTIPVYRAYHNARNYETRRSSDYIFRQRINSDIAAIQEVVAKGWTYEGVVMCAGSAPMHVYPTSYENKNNIFLDDPTIPSAWEIPNMDFPELQKQGELPWYGRALAFADFTQEGAYSAFTLNGFYKNAYPGSNPLKWPDSPAKMYFLRKNTADGKWYDITSQLIKNEGERYVCISPTFVEVADLNNDKKPDVYISCTGIDFPVGGIWTTDGNSEQYIVLSQADGTYKVSTLPIGKIYSHQAALADINNDGNVDILTVNPGTDSNNIPFILWGKGDGTFTKDVTRFPTETLAKAIFGIRAIPVNGKITVFLSGIIEGAYPTSDSHLQSVSYGLKMLQYDGVAFRVVKDMTSIIPTVAATGLQLDLALDVVYHNNAYYMTMVNRDYGHYAIVKLNAEGTVATKVAEDYSGLTGGGAGGASVIKITSQNTIVSQQLDCRQIPESWQWSYAIARGNYLFRRCVTGDLVL